MEIQVESEERSREGKYLNKKFRYGCVSRGKWSTVHIFKYLNDVGRSELTPSELSLAFTVIRLARNHCIDAQRQPPSAIHQQNEAEQSRTRDLDPQLMYYEVIIQRRSWATATLIITSPWNHRKTCQWLNSIESALHVSTTPASGGNSFIPAIISLLPRIIINLPSYVYNFFSLAHVDLPTSITYLFIYFQTY